MDNSLRLNSSDLQSIQFNFDSPFRLKLLDGDEIAIEKVVRIMPKRRLVAFGVWQGKPVVVKLFFDAKRAYHHVEKELNGIDLLKTNKIPSPTLYYQTYTEDKQTHVLILERIFHADSLDTLWQERQSIEVILPLLQAVIIEIATQHVLGVVQHDMHLKNFLVTDKVIYTLDGGQIELFPHLLPKKTSMQNLALFLAQFGVGVKAYQEKLFRYYAKARGWILKQQDIDDLFLLIKNWNEIRWRRYLRKIFRPSTDYAKLTTWRMKGMYRRKDAGKEFNYLLKNPDIAFTHTSRVMLKQGRSATVVKVTLDGREYVVKRYNIKNGWHRLRRTFRHTRARKSWCLAHKFDLFGVNTAKPVAFIERKLLGFRGKSYFVMEYIPGEQANLFFAKHRQEEAKTAAMLARVVHLLRSTAKLEITHGDLKITNILINNREQPVLIDLDGAQEHASLSSLRFAWQKEIKRFLRNFEDQPSLREKFKLELNQTQ